MKSEPDAYSIDDLERDKMEPWDGIRNYQARNMIRDDMEIGDQAFFYHSSCKVPAIVGIMKIASAAYPDPTQFDPSLLIIAALPDGSASDNVRVMGRRCSRGIVPDSARCNAIFRRFAAC